MPRNREFDYAGTIAVFHVGNNETRMKIAQDNATSKELWMTNTNRGFDSKFALALAAAASGETIYVKVDDPNSKRPQVVYMYTLPN